jgi:PKD domain
VTGGVHRGAPSASAMMSGMPGRPIGRRLAAWTASLAVLGAVAVAAAAPAVADTPTPPPWVTGALQPGDWIAYTLSNTNPPVFQRNPNPLWGPVTLTRQNNPNLSLSVLASEPGPGGQPGWPSSWSSNGITLKRADQFCALAQASCQYYVASGTGQPFFFGAAVAPPGGQAQDLSSFNQGGLSLMPPQQPVANFVAPTGGALPSSGSFTFDGSGSQAGLPGALTYRWTLLSANGQTVTQDGPQSTFTPPASTFTQNGQYCVTLVVTASDGATASRGPSCFGVTISNPTPTPPQNNPGPAQAAPTPTPPQNNPGPAQAAPTPGPPAAGPAASPVPAASLSFAKPLPNFAVPVPGAAQQVTVIWLWKPDWFQPTPSGVGKSARTGGQPKAVKRASVSVTQRANRTSPSATPWLAGLGAFGIFGAGWLAFRRRNLRSSLLD